MAESEPLLLNDLQGSSEGKFAISSENNIRCWACWETMQTKFNPLIRVCRGCKDPELQYIHQNCINAYISSLPQPRRPRSPTNIDQSAQEFLDNEEQNEVYYYCTRCRDPYIVEEREIFPLVTIWEDRWVRSIFLALAVSVVLMIISLFLIVFSRWEDDIVFFHLFGIPISLLMLATVLTVAGITFGSLLLVTVWKANIGRKKLHVTGEILNFTPV